MITFYYYRVYAKQDSFVCALMNVPAPTTTITEGIVGHSEETIYPGQDVDEVTQDYYDLPFECKCHNFTCNDKAGLELTQIGMTSEMLKKFVF